MTPPNINPHTWHKKLWHNRLQSFSLLSGMAGFLALLGYLLWGTLGLYLLVGLGLSLAIIQPQISPRLVMRLYGAKPIALDYFPELKILVTRLTNRAELQRTPQLYYIPSSMLNAFAVGDRNNAVIAVTDGLLRHLDLRHLTGVFAHEMSHIRNNDLWVMGLADMFSRGTRLLSMMGQLLLLLNLPLLLLNQITINWYAIFLLIIAPVISALAQLALSRTREYEADLGAAWLTGDPEGLARALSIIENVQGGWLERRHMPGRYTSEPSILRSHPETEERVTRLMALKPDVSPIRTHHDLDELLFTDEFLHPIKNHPRKRFNGLWY